MRDTVEVQAIPCVYVQLGVPTSESISLMNFMHFYHPARGEEKGKGKNEHCDYVTS